MVLSDKHSGNNNNLVVSNEVLQRPANSVITQKVNFHL